MAIYTTLANQLLNATVGNVTFTTPTTAYISLYSTAPNAVSTGTEIVGNGYSRQTATFTSAANAATATNVAVSFSCTGNNWPLLRAVGVMDDVSAGNLMYYTTIAGRNVTAGSTLTFDSGTITLTIT
jgi:hypothetical protein